MKENRIWTTWPLFLSEVRREIAEFHDFFCSSRLFRWFSAIWILLLYGIRLFHGDIFVDSDIMLIDPQGYLAVMHGSRRFGMVMTKKLFSFLRLTPTLANLLMMFALWLFVLLTVFFFWRLSGNDKNFRFGMIPFSAVFLSSPCLAEQFYFVLQAFEVALAMVFSSAAMYCAQMGIKKGQSWVWYLPSLGFMVWAMGTYQAFSAFYIALTVTAYVIMYQAEGEHAGWREGFLNAVLFLAGFFITQILASFFVKRVNGDSSYVNAMIVWKTQDIRDCLFFIAMDFRRIYQAELPLFFNRFFLWAAASGSLLVLGCGMKKRKKGLPYCVFALLVLFISPILITLIMGTAQPIRAHLTYVLVFAEYMFLLCALLPQLLENWRRLRIAACMFVVIFSLSISWKKLVGTNELLETAHEVYLSDNLAASRIYDAVCQAAGQENMAECRVVFVGTKDAQLAGNPTYGDVIGHSVFQWDAASDIGVSGRVGAYFRTLGLPMEFPTSSDYEKAVEASRNKPSWPQTGSVFKLEDMVVVNLSEIQE